MALLHSAALNPLSTCGLCDQYPAELACGDLRVLPPVFRHFGRQLHFLGRVATVQCLEDDGLVRAMLAQAGMARVLVVAGGGSMRHAVFGAPQAEQALRNGWAGVVVDGCVRDVQELHGAAVGVRALGCVPSGAPATGAGLQQVAVSVQGVMVRPDDWLYADADGMLLSQRALHEPAQLPAGHAH